MLNLKDEERDSGRDISWFFCNYCNVTYIGKFMKERWMLIGIRFLYNGSVDSMP